MKKRYLDVLLTGCALAFVGMYAIELYAEEDTPAIQPITFEQMDRCGLQAWQKSSRNCGTNKSFKSYGKKQTPTYEINYYYGEYE